MQVREESEPSLQQLWDGGKSAAYWINSPFHKPREWRSNKEVGWLLMNSLTVCSVS